MRNKLLTAFGIIILIGLVFQSVFGVAAALLLCSIIGLCAGVYKKDKLLAKWSLLVFILVSISIALFYFCLIHSAM